MMRHLLLFLSLCLTTTALVWSEQEARLIVCEVFPVPIGTHSGSGYTGIACGHDGKIYVGTANYGGSAHLVRFDPKSKSWDDLIDVHHVTRDRGTGLDSHSKFHAKILVDEDGIIWAATKQGNEEFANRPEYGESATGYPGGHLFSFNPGTNKITDYGILKRQEGIMGGAVDNARKRLYYWSDPKQHFLIFNIQNNTVRDLGSIGGSPRYMAIDSKGRVFGAGRQGIFWMYDPVDDTLYDLRAELQGPGRYDDPYVIVISADRKRIFGCAIGGEYIMDFDLDSIRLMETNGSNGSIVCRHRAPSLPGGVPGDQHAAALGKDGRMYFPNASSDGVHIVRYDPSKGSTEDLGILRVGNHPDMKPTAAQGACVGLDGTLYLKFISDQKTPYCIAAFDRLTI